MTIPSCTKRVLKQLLLGASRYNAALLLALTKSGFEPDGLQFLLNKELMVNFGEEISHTYFDQNRLFAGLVYQVNKHAQM